MDQPSLEYLFSPLRWVLKIKWLNLSIILFPKMQSLIFSGDGEANGVAGVSGGVVSDNSISVGALS